MEEQLEDLPWKVEKPALIQTFVCFSINLTYQDILVNLQLRMTRILWIQLLLRRRQFPYPIWEFSLIWICATAFSLLRLRWARYMSWWVSQISLEIWLFREFKMIS
jgi:hypothetical protein